jgi:flagellar basal body-associated protein FliL
MSAPRIFALAIMAILVMSLLAVGDANAAPSTITETRNIGSGEYTIISQYQAEASSFIFFTIDVQDGSYVDVLIMNATNFQAYSIGDPFNYVPESVLNKNTGAGGFSTPIEGTEYYVLIDNTNVPAGGATPIGPVTVSYTVTNMNANDIESIFNNLLVIIVVGGIAFLLVALLLLYLIFFRKPSHPSSPTAPPAGQPGTKVCSNCGSRMPYDFQYCPSCGKKW